MAATLGFQYKNKTEYRQLRWDYEKSQRVHKVVISVTEHTPLVLDAVSYVTVNV